MLGDMRRAFSLVELLIAVAVIAVIAGLLLPAVGLARDAARGTVCAGNLRQYQLANLVYHQDNPGFYVQITWFDAASAWTLLDWPRSPGFWGALSDDRASDAAQAPRSLFCPLARPSPGNWLVVTSYGADPVETMSWPPPPNTWYGAKSRVPGIAAKVAFCDALDWVIDYGGAAPGLYWSAGGGLPEGTKVTAVAYRHRRRANAVFFDGHVEALAAESMYQLSLWR